MKGYQNSSGTNPLRRHITTWKHVFHNNASRAGFVFRTATRRGWWPRWIRVSTRRRWRSAWVRSSSRRWSRSSRCHSRRTWSSWRTIHSTSTIHSFSSHFPHRHVMYFHVLKYIMWSLWCVFMFGIHFVFVLWIYYLLWTTEKARVKKNTYKWVSVQWKTKSWNWWI